MRSPFDLGAKQMKDISLRILDMECAACVARLDRALEKLPGVQRAAVNYTAASALITYDERVTDLHAYNVLPGSYLPQNRYVRLSRLFFCGYDN